MLRMVSGNRRGASVVAGLLLIALLLAAAPVTDPADRPIASRTMVESYTASLHVNVSDDVGRPVPEAIVNLIGNETSWETDDNGTVLISGLLADSNGTDYTTYAECAGYLSSSPTGLTLTPGNTSYVNLTVRGGGIFGTVSADGAPLPDTNITLLDSVLNPVVNTLTASDGSYTLEGIKGGTYSVVANATFYATVTKIVTVTVGDYIPLHFSLVSLRGGISGTVLHVDTEEPLQNASVAVAVEDYTITVVTDANGSYHVPNIPAGTYSLTVSLAGFNTTIVEDVVVVSGATTEGVDVLLIEKPTVLKGVVKAGTVLLVGANVSVVGTDRYGISSIQGEYEIRNIPAGVYTVIASLQGYDNATILNVQIDLGSEVQLNINLTGKLGGALYGIVIDENTGASLSGVRVTLLPQRETITNINGEFQFTGLESGDYTIMFTLEGYRPVEMGDISVGSENRTELGFISLEPIRESFGGFIFGFDLAHSMMILALFLTIVILALAVVLRIRSFEAPDKAPAVYDELEESDEEEESDDSGREDEEIYEN
jgi:hypothetical protein